MKFERKYYLEGNRYGGLLVLEYVGSSKYLCLCDCGNEKEILTSELVRTDDKARKSCGCYPNRGRNLKTHGMSKTSEYTTWKDIKRKCYNENHQFFYRYGGRGIYVCDRWLNSFENFYVDMGSRPDKTYSLGRIDNDGPYSPENCQWETPEQQANNKSTNVLITRSSDGLTMTASQWARHLNMNASTIYSRLKYGNLTDDEVLEPVVKQEPKPKTKKQTRQHNLEGEKFGLLSVIEYIGEGNGVYLCKCDCGNDTKAAAYLLENGLKKSCGCIRGKPGEISNKNIPGYKSWQGMKSRCYRETSPKHKNYGARGIIVCERWLNSFENFLEDMGPKPGPEYSLGRIDNDANYTPENCRWETVDQQMNNTTRTRTITRESDGLTMTIAQWTRYLGVSKSTIHSRIKSGWTEQEAISIGVKKSNLISVNGVCYDSQKQASIDLGISQVTLYRRLKSNNYPEYIRL